MAYDELLAVRIRLALGQEISRIAQMVAIHTEKR